MRAQWKKLRASSFELCVRDPGRHGHQDPQRSQSATHNDSHGPLHELLGQIACLHSTHRNLYRASLRAACRGRSPFCDALRGPRARAATGMGPDQIFSENQNPTVHFGDAGLPGADAKKYFPAHVGARAGIRHEVGHRDSRVLGS